MDIASTISEIRTLSVADRLRLVDAILESIGDDDALPPMSDALAAELDRRLADHLANPADVVPWRDVKASVEARLGR